MKLQKYKKNVFTYIALRNGDFKNSHMFEYMYFRGFPMGEAWRIGFFIPMKDLFTDMFMNARGNWSARKKQFTFDKGTDRFSNTRKCTCTDLELEPRR